MYEDYKALRIERRGKILVLTMDNPPLNTMSHPLHDELSRIFFDINRDPNTAVVVLTGAGEKAFCAGGDVEGMKRRLDEKDFESWFRKVNEARDILYGLLELERPLITRINGHAMGLGSTLAVYSDFSFMVESAIIADTHVKMGLAAGDGGSMMWPLLIGFNRAKHYLLTGDTMTGAEAADNGLISKSVATLEELDDEVFGLAERLASGASQAINATKISINMLLRRILEGMPEAHLAQETRTILTDDHYEAASAFLDKRTPSFKGS